MGFSGLKRALTGEIIDQIDIDIGGGLGLLSFLLKRERKSERYYVVLVGRSGGNWYYPFELAELDEVITAADEIRVAQSKPSGESPFETRNLGQLTDMILTGDVVRQIDIKLSDGYLTLSFRLKRKINPPHEYVVLGTLASGQYIYYPFELDEFYRFVNAAKKNRAQTPDSYDRLQQNKSDIATPKTDL
jgi:hypothetical protein